MKERDKVVDLETASIYAPTAPSLRDDLAEATGPAIFELRKCPADRAAVAAILEGVPPHLWGAVAESASSRNIVPREVVALVLEEIGFNRLTLQCGGALAANMVHRFWPKTHPIFAGNG